MTLTLMTNPLPKDLKRILHYWTNAEGKTEPALFLVREGHFGRSACITLSSAYLYDEPDRQTPEMLRETARIVAGMVRHLDLVPCSQTAQQLLMFIQDGLEDLKAMPPWTPRRQVIGEAVLHMDGERVTKDITET